MKNVTYINAGAGSGKTYTLIEKLTELIKQHGINPEQVILTTFTVKAANEFKEKAKAKLYEQGLYDAATRLDQALIGTVHSICQRMIGKYWFHLGLSPDMGVMAEEDAQYYISQSLADLPTEEELAFLHEFCENFNLRLYDGFAKKELNYNFWQDQLKRIISFATNYELDDFQESEKRSIAFIQKLCNGTSITVTDEELRKMHSEAKSHVEKNNRIRKKDEYYKNFENTLLNKKDKKIAWTTELRKNFKPKYGPICELVSERLNNQWMSTEVCDIQTSYIHIMFDLAKRWQENFALFKREKNLLDYNDMEKYMRQLLLNKNVVSEISHSYRYLFVDEFQDSSPIQVKIFDALSELMEHSFWVGDCKQSIYGFRSSDIDMVNAVVDRVMHTDGCDTYSLDKCWRSLPDIVEVNNKVFTQTFQNVLDHDKIYLNPQRQNDGGEKSLRYFISDNLKDVSDHIAQMVKNGIRPNDIAVLARRNDALANIAKNLKGKYGIPANREDMSVVGTKTYILTEALLRIVNSDKDLLAKAQVAFLTEENLSTTQIIEKKLLFDNDKANKKNDFLSEIDLVNKLSEIKPMLHQQSVAAAIETMIIELGLFDVVKKVEDDSALGASCLKTIIDVAKIYEEHSVQMNFPATIDGFIRYVDEVCPKVAGDPAGVQLHTYHSCKGLQWKYVILTDLNNDVTDTGKIIKHDIYGVHFARDNKPTADNPYPKVHIRLAQWIYDRKIPDEIEDKICAMDLFKEAQKSAEEESNRLLYVGMTRPRDVLILEVDKKGEFFKWFKCIGVNGIAPDVSLAEGDLLGTGAKFTNVTLEDKDIAELAGYRYNNDDVRTRTIPIKKKAEKPCLPPRYISPSEINEIGNAEEVYNFNQRISFSNQPADMATVGDCIHNVFAICDNALPITPEKVKNIVFNHRLYNVFSDEREIINAWNNLTGYLKQTHGEAVKIYHERPFRLERDGHTIVGSMDLVWQTAEGDILIDFKTCPMGFRAILDKNSSHYAGRYAGQLRAYTEALVAAGETVITRYAYYPVSGLLVKII